MKKFLTLFLLLLLTRCSSTPTLLDERPRVLVTFSPYAFLVKQIAGDLVAIEILIPTGNNPHIFDPSASEVDRLRDLAIWFKVGEVTEKKVENKLPTRSPNAVTVNVNDIIDLIGGSCCHHKGEGGDLHTWLSPKLFSRQAHVIEETLASVFPQHAATFHKNGKKLQWELTKLDRDIDELLKELEPRLIVTAHPAFAYYCLDYNLEQLSIECEGKGPLPQWVEGVYKQAKHKGAKRIFLLPGFSPRGAQRLAEQLEIPTILLDPYQENYLENMRIMTRKIAGDSDD